MPQRDGPRERGPRRARRGAVRDAVLVALAERPMHGYELITELEARSAGRWRPSPGAIYPALKRMADDGLITAEEHEDRKVFTLTDLGREARTALPDDGGDPWRDEATDGHGALRALPSEIAGQARQIRRFGSPEQVERAAALLREVKRQLYAVLAEEPAPDRREDDPDR